MKRLFILSVLAIQACTSTPRLIMDIPDLQHPNLRHFRSMQDSLPTTITPAPSTQGLASLSASGSAEFSGVGWTELLQKIPSQNVIIVDLRQESHGLLNHAIPVSWYGKHDWANLDKSLSQIEIDENKRLQKLLKTGTAKLGHKDPNQAKQQVPVKTVSTEKAFVEGHGVRSMRFPTPDHRRPDTATVQAFVTWIRDLPPEAWLHFHCEAGDGRTTTFLAMLDMMKNAKTVSLKDILERQWILGGENLMNLRSKSDWQHPYFVERLQFLHHFYQYARSNSDGFQTPFVQ